MNKLYAGCAGYFVGALMFQSNLHILDYAVGLFGIVIAIVLSFEGETNNAVDRSAK